MPETAKVNTMSEHVKVKSHERSAIERITDGQSRGWDGIKPVYKEMYDSGKYRDLTNKQLSIIANLKEHPGSSVVWTKTRVSGGSKSSYEVSRIEWYGTGNERIYSIVKRPELDTLVKMGYLVVEGNSYGYRKYTLKE